MSGPSVSISLLSPNNRQITLPCRSYEVNRMLDSEGTMKASGSQTIIICLKKCFTLAFSQQSARKPSEKFTKQCPSIHQSRLLFAFAGCHFLCLVLFISHSFALLSQIHCGTFNPTFPSAQIVSSLYLHPNPSLLILPSQMSFAQVPCLGPTGCPYSMRRIVHRNLTQPM